MPILASNMSLKWLNMLILPWKVVFLLYLWEMINFLWGTRIFFQIYSKNDRFLTKMAKMIPVSGRKLKNHVSKQFENPASPTNVIFGQIEPLGGFTIAMWDFSFFCHFHPFWPQNVQNFGFFCIFPIFLYQKCQKWAKMTKYGKFLHNVCKTSLEGQFGQKSHL